MSEHIFSGRRLRRFTIIGLVWIIMGFSFVMVYAQQPSDVPEKVAWSPDGQTIAVSGQFGIRLYTTSLTLKKTFLNAGTVTDIAWSPDSTKLAAADLDYTVRVWNVATATVFTFFRHDGSVRSVSWSPDGSKVASASDDGTVRIWSMPPSGSSILIKPDATDMVGVVAWSPDGTKLLGGARDARLYIWDATTGNLVLRGDPVDFQTSAAWSADNKTIAFDQGDLYDAITGKSWASIGVPCLIGTLDGVASSNSPTKMAFAGSDGICIFDPTTLMETFEFSTKGRPELSIALSPTGDRVVATGPNGVLSLWNTTTGLLTASTPIVATPTPVANPKPLTFGPECRLDATHTQWLIDNLNPYDVEIEWRVNNSPTNQRGHGVVPAAQPGNTSDLAFVTLDEAPGYTVSLYINPLILVGTAPSLNPSPPNICAHGFSSSSGGTLTATLSATP